VLALVNNDIEVISGGWLSEMLGLALSPGVGAVGAKLLYPSGQIQHAGVVGGLFGVAGHLYKHQPHSAVGLFGELTFAREVLAVTAACMLVTRRAWDEAGGLNERDLAVAFNDVDLCFRLRKLGYRNLWTPHAELVHHESVSRGSDERPSRRAAFQAEIQYMKKTWPEFLSADPYFNPNLSLEAHVPQVAWPPRVHPFFREGTNTGSGESQRGSASAATLVK
jgi:GT2 family glycosyltransferase